MLLYTYSKCNYAGFICILSRSLYIQHVCQRRLYIYIYMYRGLYFQMKVYSFVHCQTMYTYHICVCMCLHCIELICSTLNVEWTPQSKSKGKKSTQDTHTHTCQTHMCNAVMVLHVHVYMHGAMCNRLSGSRYITLLPSFSDCVHTVIITGQGVAVPALHASAVVHQADGPWE